MTVLESDMEFRLRLLEKLDEMGDLDRCAVPRVTGTGLDEIGRNVGLIRRASLLEVAEDSIGEAERKTYDTRRYLPTLADLVDRLTIVQQKMIFIPENVAEYAKERADIEHDIDLILIQKAIVLTATDIHAICMIMLTNRFIWENESKARNGGAEQDKLLKLTHSINGVRNTAKNALARVDSGRKDYKIDALAADLPAEFGNWKVFGV